MKKPYNEKNGIMDVVFSMRCYSKILNKASRKHPDLKDKLRTYIETLSKPENK